MERTSVQLLSRTSTVRPPLGTSEAATLASGLERIRESVHRWVDRIELHLKNAPQRNAPERDAELVRGQRELEDQRHALRAETERFEREWEARLEALEHDRKLLAEAWERLERDQLSGVAAPRSAPHPPTVDRAVAAPRVARPPADETENAIDRTILRQFEALRQDVRNKAGSRRIV
jgi:hypothetical protein